MQNKAFEKIKEKQREFEEVIENTTNCYKNLFILNLRKNKKINISNEINNKIEEYVEIYQKNVLNKISHVIDLLIEEKINNNKEIIGKIQLFFENFLRNCYFDFDFEDDLQNDEQILYFLKIKILIIERIISFFEDCKNKIKEHMRNKEKKYKDMVDSILKKMNELKDYVEKNHEFENEDKIHQKWIKYTEYKIDERHSIKKIKEYLKKYIKQDLNLKMDYVYDSQFCLWIIKNEYEKYFD